MSRYRVLIPDGDSSFCGGVVRGLAADGSFRPQVLARSRWAPVRFSRYCDRFDLLAGEEHDENHIAMWAKAWLADVLLPVAEPAIRAAIVSQGMLQNILRLPPLPALDMFDIAGDKWQLAQFLKKTGHPHPPTELLGHDTDAALSQIPFPALLKPRRGSNGIGIRRYERPEVLRDALNRDPSAALDCVIQSIVNGTDIDCSVLCINGQIVAWTVQRQIESATSGFRSAGAIEFVQEPRVVDVAARLMKAMNWSGVAHLDMRIDAASGELYVIEMNPRYWGSLLGSLCAGVNFAAMACRMALNLPLPAAKQLPCQYLSGSAMLRSLWRPRRHPSTEGAIFRTALRHIIGDPGPEFMEIASGLLPSRFSTPRA